LKLNIIKFLAKIPVQELKFYLIHKKLN